MVLGKVLQLKIKYHLLIIILFTFFFGGLFAYLIFSKSINEVYGDISFLLFILFVAYIFYLMVSVVYLFYIHKKLDAFYRILVLIVSVIFIYIMFGIFMVLHTVTP